MLNCNCKQPRLMFKPCDVHSNRYLGNNTDLTANLEDFSLFPELLNLYVSVARFLFLHSRIHYIALSDWSQEVSTLFWHNLNAFASSGHYGGWNLRTLNFLRSFQRLVNCNICKCVHSSVTHDRDSASFNIFIYYPELTSHSMFLQQLSWLQSHRWPSWKLRWTHRSYWIVSSCLFQLMAFVLCVQCIQHWMDIINPKISKGSCKLTGSQHRILHPRLHTLCYRATFRKLIVCLQLMTCS